MDIEIDAGGMTIDSFVAAGVVVVCCNDVVTGAVAGGVVFVAGGVVWARLVDVVLLREFGHSKETNCP